MSFADERLAQSFEQVAPMHAAAARHFYARLLETAPELHPLMRHEMAGQGEMFMATLGVLVRAIREVPALLPVAAGMAERYLSFGAGPERLAQVGEALVDTFATLLGDSFTDETRSSWRDAYRALSTAMTNGAGQASAA